jgi:hypothetical protein
MAQANAMDELVATQEGADIAQKLSKAEADSAKAQQMRGATL